MLVEAGGAARGEDNRIGPERLERVRRRVDDLQPDTAARARQADPGGVLRRQRLAQRIQHVARAQIHRAQPSEEEVLIDDPLLGFLQLTATGSGASQR